MSDGLITRIGKWIDNKWETKATWRELQNQESECSRRHVGALTLITELGAEVRRDHAELAELKTRMEKIELYSGMTRKVDPTKPPVAKSAFSM